MICLSANCRIFHP